MFYDSRADVLLLDITATIPDKFTPYLLGFDASEDAVPDRAIGIHHPNGSVKRISYANSRRGPSPSSYLPSSAYPIEESAQEVACLHTLSTCSVMTHQASREVRAAVDTRAFLRLVFSDSVKEESLLYDNCLMLQRQHLHILCGQEVPGWRDSADQRHPPAGLNPHPSPSCSTPPNTAPRKHTALLTSHAFQALRSWYHAWGTPDPGMSSDRLNGPPQVTWTDGATAPGSSGSPLIDLESGKVVGVLTGGFASCASRSGPDYYGRLSAVTVCPSCWQHAGICFCPPACLPAMRQLSCNQNSIATPGRIMCTACCQIALLSWEEGSEGKRHLKTHTIVWQGKRGGRRWQGCVLMGVQAEGFTETDD